MSLNLFGIICHGKGNLGKKPSGHKINYWICHGTLLGLVRDKKIISNNSDIDIAIWKNDYVKKKCMKCGHILEGYDIKEKRRKKYKL